MRKIYSRWDVSGSGAAPGAGSLERGTLPRTVTSDSEAKLLSHLGTQGLTIAVGVLLAVPAEF